MKVFTIEISGVRQVIVIAPKVLEIFLEARQLASNARETGGLLFATISPEVVCISEASRADAKASASRFLFLPNQRDRQRTIKKAFSRGFHFVGEWHTHPEPDPSPSGLDKYSMRESFICSVHELNWFLMIIVGNCHDHLSISATLHDANDIVSLGVFQISES